MSSCYLMARMIFILLINYTYNAVNSTTVKMRNCEIYLSVNFRMLQNYHLVMDLGMLIVGVLKREHLLEEIWLYIMAIGSITGMSNHVFMQQSVQNNYFFIRSLS